MPNITVCQDVAFGSHKYELAVELRQQVLRLPLGLDFAAGELDGEANDYHLVALQGSALVACLVLSPQTNNSIKMRQVAVTPECQGQGLGKQLVTFSEEFARNLGFELMVLNARANVVPFYERLGYEVVGDPFTEVTIPHSHMRKNLKGA